MDQKLDIRRLVAFLMLSLAAMLFFNSLFPPARKPPQPAPAAGGADGKDQPGEGAPVAADRKAEPAKADAAPPAAPGPLPAVADSNLPLQYVTVGSLDMESDFRMLVTLTSAGAAVHRAEMASPRFRDQHDWSGYLGDLEVAEAQGGVQVRVVGAGTPAARATATGGKLAPLEVGDVIVGVGAPEPVEVKTVQQFAAAMSTTEPGQQLTLQVRHGEAAPEPRTVRLMRRPFAVVRPELENYTMRGVKPPEDFVERPSFLLTLAAIDNKPLDKDVAKQLATLLETGNWELTQHDQSSATFRRALPEWKLEITKRYKLTKAPAAERDNPTYPAYDLMMDIELRNMSDAPRAVAYRLDGPTGMPLEGWWFSRKISQHWGGGGLRDVAVRFAGSPEISFDDARIAKGKVDPMGAGQTLAYAGVDGQYFSSVLLPQIASLDDPWFETTEAIVVGPLPPPDQLSFTNVTCRLNRIPLVVASEKPHKDSYRVFMGPKRPGLLAQYYAANDPNYSLKDLLYFGWPIFAAVAQLMLGILHFFYSIVGNYGIAIILLTVLVRGALFPLSYKQTQSMARIQALKPEMDRINEKYKSDMQKRSQATQELYRKHNINPLAGCLPVFLQLPVFIGLYRALSVDVELRQSPLFGHYIRWCSNLAAPDMLWSWSSIMPDFVNSGQGIFGLGPYLNVLPLVTVVLFLVTQKMAMPEPTNEQQVMQQKMMKYMTVFMGLLFYKVASGLCIYFIASSLWGIAERKLLPKPKPADAAASGGASGGGGKGPSGGKGSGGPGTNGSPGTKSAKAKRKK